MHRAVIPCVVAAFALPHAVGGCGVEVIVDESASGGGSGVSGKTVTVGTRGTASGGTGGAGGTGGDAGGSASGGSASGSASGGASMVACPGGYCRSSDTSSCGDPSYSADPGSQCTTLVGEAGYCCLSDDPEASTVCGSDGYCTTSSQCQPGYGLTTVGCSIDDELGSCCQSLGM